VAKLVARQAVNTALWVRIQTSLENIQNGRHRKKDWPTHSCLPKNKQKRTYVPHLDPYPELFFVLTKKLALAFFSLVFNYHKVLYKIFCLAMENVKRNV